MFYETKAFGERCFGDLEKLLNSDMDPKYLVLKLKEENIDFPKFYMACGLQDGLLPKSDEFAAFLKENGIDSILDDRENLTIGAKIKDCKVFGTPYLVVLGDKQDGENIELENTKTGEIIKCTINEIIYKI